MRQTYFQDHCNDEARALYFIVFFLWKLKKKSIMSFSQVSQKWISSERQKDDIQLWMGTREGPWKNQRLQSTKS